MNKKSKKKKKLSPISLNWGDQPNVKLGSQNAMNSPENPFSHEDTHLVQATKEQGDWKVVFRGYQNAAPQKDIQLGLRSITHKKIASKLARLVQGQGLEFYIKDPENDRDNLTQEEQAQLEAAQDWIKSKSINEAWAFVASGLVYQNLGSIIAAHDDAESSVVDGQVQVQPRIKRANGQLTQELRFRLPR